MTIQLSETMTIAEILEDRLGNNLQRLYDKLDLQVRQNDRETIEILSAINEAWQISCLLLASEQYGKKLGTTFTVIGGNSVIDTLAHNYLDSKKQRED